MSTFLVAIVGLNFFLSSVCFGQELTTIVPDDDSDAPENCGHYRRLARISNTFSDRGEKCCENLGCFSNKKGTPWEHLGQKPDCMSDIKPEFFLFTPENNTAQSFDYFSFNATVDSLRINTSKPFFVVIHGYNTQWPNNFMFPMKDELIRLVRKIFIKGIRNTKALYHSFCKMRLFIYACC